MTSSLKQKMLLILLSAVVFNPAMAKSVGEESKNKQASSAQHEGHSKLTEESQKYRGVFYGFLPCKDCEGMKTTLSLKNKNNYLLVTQPAKISAREFFDKGKYTWDDETKLVTLTSRKKGGVRKYRINNEKSITLLSPEGLSLKAKQKNTSYKLHRNEMKKKSGGGGHGTH